MPIYVKPVVLGDGTLTRVRQPNRAWAVLPPEGAWVDEDEYWSRRLRDKDCEIAEPPAEALPEFSDEEKVGEATGVEHVGIEMTVDADGVARGELVADGAAAMPEAEHGAATVEASADADAPARRRR